MCRIGFSLCVAVALLLGLPAVTGAAAHGLDGAPAVTLIGDSVAEGIPGDAAALRTLDQGIALDLEVAPCRRLTGTSCPPSPPTALDVIKGEGSAIAPSVVIAVGYNDFESQYADEIEQILDALERANVEHVFWLTLREARGPYPAMNSDIANAATRHPELTIIDWNEYSANHPEWFQDDGLHLLAPGSEAMAALIHQRLLDAHIAVPPVAVATTVIPRPHPARSYRFRFTADGGRAPYSWSLTGRLPKGLHLLASGTLAGTPRRPGGTFVVTVKVKDAIGQAGTRKFLILMR
jgi:hypothetical protein